MRWLVLLSVATVLAFGMSMPHFNEDMEDALVQRIIAKMNATLLGGTSTEQQVKGHQRRAVEGKS